MLTGTSNQAREYPTVKILVSVKRVVDYNVNAGVKPDGLVHRVEGDLANSRYWCERAGKKLDEARCIEEELSELRKCLEGAG